MNTVEMENCNPAGISTRVNEKGEVVEAYSARTVTVSCNIKLISFTLIASFLLLFALMVCSVL